MSSRRKQEEKHLQALKEALKIECNKRCCECDQRGPTYVDVTVGSFVCTSCGGILRGLNPPHRIKSVSMATFTPSEIAFVETRGNEYCKNIYLGKYDSRSKAKPESKSDHGRLKMFMEQKYEQKRWYVPPEEANKPLDSFIKSATNNKATQQTKPLTSLLGANATPLRVDKPAPPKQQQNVSNLLADISISGSITPNANQAENFGGFADFGNAFSSPSKFEAFGEFTSGQPNNTTDVTSSASFGAFSNVIPTPLTTNQPPASKPADKYADLGDLFNVVTTADVTTMWSPASSSQATSGQNISIFGASSSQQPVSSQSAFASSAMFGAQPGAFGTTQQFPGVYASTQSQQNAVNMQQQSANAFGTMNSTTMNNNLFQGMQNPTPLFVTSPQQNVMGGNYFMGTQAIPTGYGMPAQQGFTTQPTQPYMSTSQQMVTPNPFMQSATQPTTASQMRVNPFMTSQQQVPTQTPATNPFMNIGNPAPTQQNQSSTNPFF